MIANQKEVPPLVKINTRYVDLETFDQKAIKKYKIKKNKIIVYLANGEQYSIINTKENENKINEEMNNFQKEYYNEIIRKEEINILKNKDDISANVIRLVLGIGELVLSFIINGGHGFYSLCFKVTSIPYMCYATYNIIKDIVKISINKSKIKNIKKMKLYFDNEELIKGNVNEDVLENVNNKELDKNLDMSQVRKMKIEELQKLIDSIKFYQQYDFETYDDLNKSYSEKEIEELSNKYNEEGNQKKKVRTTN